MKNIPLSSPDITEKEIEAVEGVLQTRFLAMGPKTRQFEEQVAALAGRRYGVAVNSGTSGLHLLVRALDIGEGDEVITTPFSFVASANCILFERARPVFVDIDPDTLNIDPSLIEAAITPRTRAILPVHVFGRPACMDRIIDIAGQYGLKVIEDACEAVGARYREKAAGGFGDGSVFAFYPNKQLTTGEGGLVVTDDARIAGLCRSMRNQGRKEGGGWFDHERLGFNYRMDELSAALGLAQLERLAEILQKRERVAGRYIKKLKLQPEIKLPAEPVDSTISWFVFVVGLPHCVQRDRVIQYMEARGVQCRPYFAPIHLQPYYKKLFGYSEGAFPAAESAGRSALALPFYNNLSEREIDYVTENLKEAIRLARA